MTFTTKLSTTAVALIGALALAGAALAAGPAPKTDAPKTGIGTKGYVWNAEGGEKDEALHLKPDVKNGKDVYEVCSACHMPEGWGMTDGTFPQIAGQHTKVTIKQLADIRALNRDNPTMYPFALPSEIGGPQSISDVAAYIAKLPMNPAPGVGDGKDLELGKKLYKDNCVRCHGEDGAGDDAKYYPRIHGQHYNYLLRQYVWIKEGKRRNANPEMVEQIKLFSDRDTKAVLDYVARLKPPKAMLAPSKDYKNPDFK